ncbi:MAG: glycosyltransferase family 92 protein [Treponemataceae bacterium]
MLTFSQEKYFIIENNVIFSLKYILKKLIFYFTYLPTKALLNINKPKKIESKKYKVSIVAIFKNEAPYLKEWIEFHKIIGIDHFYMYNNNSDDNFYEILSPYIEENSVTLIHWEKNQAQMECYINAIENFKNESEWIGFIDIDEFIVPNSTENIYDFFKPFQKNRPAVLLYWKMFGSSKLKTRDIDNLVIGDFKKSYEKYCNIGKCFFNTMYEYDYSCKYNKVLHHHLFCKYKGISLPPVNCFDKICKYDFNLVNKNTNPNDFPIQINHYFTKSYDEYMQKKTKGDVYFKKNPHDDEYFYKRDALCVDTDTHIAKYTYLLKKKLTEKMDNSKNE